MSRGGWQPAHLSIGSLAFTVALAFVARAHACDLSPWDRGSA